MVIYIYIYIYIYSLKNSYELKNGRTWLTAFSVLNNSYVDVGCSEVHTTPEHPGIDRVFYRPDCQSVNCTVPSVLVFAAELFLGVYLDGRAPVRVVTNNLPPRTFIPL